jgi:UDP-N-acetylglucosamine--N-acetylmuramyl-(pentapeptide) pyrophosphoryl-undecaprenol N-acetylglucosamine transferase
MEKFFPSSHLLRTGNPVRSEISGSKVMREEAHEFFGLKPEKPTVLVIGGSLGARSINAAVESGFNVLTNAGIQVIWQTGKGNLTLSREALRKRKDMCVTEFISKMNYAYAAADVVVSRAGAIALAEICATAKPSVLVPFPHAAEDHQRVNAKALVDAGAAILVEDAQASEKLMYAVKELILDEAMMKRFSSAATSLYVKEADVKIATAITQKMEGLHV